MRAAGGDARFASVREGMKIGIDATSWSNWRGFGRFTRSLVRSLVRIDSQNQYVLFFDSGYEKCAGVPQAARHIKVATTVPQDEAIGPASRRSLADIWRMTRAVAAEGLDLFFSPSVDSYFPVFKVARKVLAIYDANIDEMPEVILSNRRARLLRWIKMRVALRQADLVITGSAYSRAQIKSVLGFDDSRVGIVPGGVDPIFRPPESIDHARQIVRERYGIAGPYFLYVGGPGPTKNLQALADSFAALKSEREVATLAIAGKAEPGGELEMIARKLGSGAHLLGFQSDEALVELYQAALALVIPSLKEGYGLPGVEAVSCGTPAIVTIASPLPELLGAAAIAVDPHRPSEITEAMRAMLLNREARETARSAAIALAGRFSWEHSARAAVELFERVARKNSGMRPAAEMNPEKQR